jgi:hypothetical protein
MRIAKRYYKVAYGTHQIQEPERMLDSLKLTEVGPIREIV